MGGDHRDWGRIYFEEIAPPAAATWETVWLTEHATGILDGNIIDGNGTSRGGCAGLVFSALEEPESEHDVDTYTIIFAALAVVIFLRLRSALGQRTGSGRPSYVTGILLTLTAVALGAVFFDVGGANWYPVPETAPSTTAVRTISGPARVIDGDTVVVAGTTVRLKGVDAAELGTARGENARRVMATLVTGQLTCRLTGEKTYRREVGYCATANGADIN